MRKIIVIFFRFFYIILLELSFVVSKSISYFIFYVNGVKFESIHCYGIPYIHISLSGKCIIGNNLKMHNGVWFSDSGTNGKCRIDVRENATLIIGQNVGMSDITIACHEKIFIGDNVMLGVGVQLRDTDNHSLNSEHRKNSKTDWANKKNAPIYIGNNVFIGAYSLILKGVNIGDDSILGAGSVLTKDIPSNQLWAGNPARFIRSLNSNNDENNT